jgi:hypothetical protein
MSENTNASPIESLLADFRLQRKRLASMTFTTPDDARRELMNNVFPSLEALAEQVAEVDNVVTEVIDQQGSFLEEELANQILGTIAVAETLIEAFRPLMLPLDDLAKKKLESAITEYARMAELTVMAVTEAAGLDDDDDDEDDEEESEETPAEPEKEGE